MLWVFGTDSLVLTSRLGFVLVVALLGALAGVLLLDLPLWTFGALTGATVVSCRIGVLIALRFVSEHSRELQPTVPELQTVNGKTRRNADTEGR